ncbi:MAG: response regulator [Caulobacteraceae bacterium]|nr:response regulator [Caulobacteraceae bacterium]
MTSAVDLLLALDTPAALFAADGRLTAANAAFEACGADPTRIAAFLPNEIRETLGGDGVLIRWSVRELPGGARLSAGTPAASGLSERDRYLAAMSHELRTPLNGVLGMAGLLADTPLADEQKAYLTTLRDCGAHLLGLVNDVLDLARLDAGQLTLHPARADLKALLQSTAELLSPRAHGKGLDIAWQAPADLPPVLADEGRLRQILFNLAGNAVKFTDRGGVLLGVEAAPGQGGQVAVRFSVLDTGPGVPPQARERIFEAFTQGSREHAARTDSSGLGLAIVRRLVAAHGGRVGLDAPAAGGSRFWFEAEFPLADAGAPRNPARPLAHRTVAVVSQSRILKAAAGAMVEAAGGAAHLASSAAAVSPSLPPDTVVLVDHGQGPRRKRPAAGRPSVILLAPEQRAHIPAYRAAGFAGYLIKPLRDVSLVERVLAALDGSAAPVAGQDQDERAAAQPIAAHVLLAEDNPINAVLARSLLEREGCRVDRVASGEEALAAALSHAYDLIFMDQRMPGLDGRAAAQALRARGCRTPIIALTADAFEEDRRACLAAGMDDFLTKPLEQAVLRAMLRRWVRPDWTPGRQEAKLSA